MLLCKSYKMENGKFDIAGFIEAYPHMGNATSVAAWAVRMGQKEAGLLTALGDLKPGEAAEILKFAIESGGAVVSTGGFDKAAVSKVDIAAVKKAWKKAHPTRPGLSNDLISNIHNNAERSGRLSAAHN